MTKDDIKCGCDAILRLRRDCEFSCMLEAGHGGPHYDEFEYGDNTVAVVWHEKKFTIAIANEGDVT